MSHSVLLIRLPKEWGDASSLQMDIAFLDVTALCLPANLPDPVIRYVDLSKIEPNVKPRPDRGTHGFALEGPGWSGWVQALRVAYCRTHQEFFEISLLEDDPTGIGVETHYFPS